MRKMGIKKVWISMLAAAMVLSASGCKDSSKKKPAPPANINDVSTDLQPATLTFYLPGSKPADSQEVLQQVEKNSNLNIKLNFVYVGNNYEYVLTQEISAGKLDADAFYVGRTDYSTMADFSYLAASGSLKDITELFPKYAPNICKRFSENELKAIEVNGKLYAVPCLLTNAYVLNAAVKKDLMEKYNLPAINTLDDYELYLKTVKEHEKNVVPGYLFYPSASMFAGLYDYVVLDDSEGLVYKKDDPKMTVMAWEQTPEFKKVSAYLTRWSKSGYLWDMYTDKNSVLGSALTKNDDMKEGSRIIQYSSGSSNSKDYVFYNYVLEKDKPKQRMNPIGDMESSPAIAINPKSKNAERVLMFLNWVQSKQENYDLFIYGIKGKDYDLNGEKLVSVQNNNSNFPYRYWSSNAFSNMNFYRTGDNDYWPDNMDKKEYESFIQTKTFSVPHEGFSPDYTNLQEEAKWRGDELIQSLKAVQYKGAITEEDLNNIVQELNSPETQKIINEVQKQLDTYKKK